MNDFIKRDIEIPQGIHKLRLDTTLDLNKVTTSPQNPKKWVVREQETLFQLKNLQENLCAENKQRVLIILQAMDAGGKDGVIRHLFMGMDPQGARVVNFKEPTPQEQQRDYLWRIHKEVPTTGEMVVFNRSHFEDILVGRIRSTISDETIDLRIQHINQFEKLLSDEGTTIIKIFLHISKKEQFRRFEKRLNSVNNGWKLTRSDLQNHNQWHRYTNAYSELLPRTSTEWAPWYVVPADHRQVRNVLVTELILNYMIKLNPVSPVSEVDVTEFNAFMNKLSMEY